MVNEALLTCQKIRYIVKKQSLSFDYYGEIIQVTDDLFNTISDEINPQGILAVIDIPKTDIFKPEKSCILLDGISDPGNIGTIIRTAAACGYKDIYLCNCVDPFNPKSVRASMSGIYYVNLINIDRNTVNDIINIPIITADINGQNLFNFTPPEKFCLVIGNEANGVTDIIKNKSDYIVKIPMKSSVESLNAAVSAGIIMYNLIIKKFKEN
jgi:TrmH family RNA methyltransferase